MSKGKQMSLFEVWTVSVPLNFPKGEVLERLADRWGITRTNAYNALKAGKLKNFVHDLSFLYTNYGLGYTMDKGFFFDALQFEKIRMEAERKLAEKYKLSKAKEHAKV